MGIIGIDFDKTNPTFELSDFKIYIPKLKPWIEASDDNLAIYNKFLVIVNQIIYKDIWGANWEMATSLAIAHYILTITGDAETGTTNVSDIANSSNPKGVVTSYSVGGLSKSMDFDRAMVTDDYAMFWNTTVYGQKLMTLEKTLSIPTMFIGAW